MRADCVVCGKPNVASLCGHCAMYAPDDVKQRAIIQRFGFAWESDGSGGARKVYAEGEVAR